VTIHLILARVRLVIWSTTLLAGDGR
jgi:hypothetical protein